MYPGYNYEVGKMRDIPRLKKIMDTNIATAPEFYRRKMGLLDDFFEEHPAPVDIALMMFDAFNYSHVLAYHLEGNNLMFYRPKASHKRKIAQTFLDGVMHPERTLLLFDSDIVTGDALSEAREFFSNSGYQVPNIFAYLDYGFKDSGGVCQLMHIDEFLRSVRPVDKNI